MGTRRLLPVLSLSCYLSAGLWLYCMLPRAPNQIVDSLLGQVQVLEVAAAAA